jgi:predicted nucleic acid-binding protein
MRLLTIGSHVFGGPARFVEFGHAESAAFRSWVRNARPRLFPPTLVMAEVAAALSRTVSEPSLAQPYYMAVSQLPNTVMVVLDEGSALQAAALRAQHQLRGADSVYLASAVLFAAELVTLDRKQLKRGAAIVQTLAPAGFLATITWWRFSWGINCLGRFMTSASSIL